MSANFYIIQSAVVCMPAVIFALFNRAAYAAVNFIAVVHNINTSRFLMIYLSFMQYTHIYKSKTGLDFTVIIVCALPMRFIRGNFERIINDIYT